MSLVLFAHFSVSLKTHTIGPKLFLPEIQTYTLNEITSGDWQEGVCGKVSLLIALAAAETFIHPWDTALCCVL